MSRRMRYGPAFSNHHTEGPVPQRLPEDGFRHGLTMAEIDKWRAEAGQSPVDWDAWMAKKQRRSVMRRAATLAARKPITLTKIPPSRSEAVE